MANKNTASTKNTLNTAAKAAAKTAKAPKAPAAPLTNKIAIFGDALNKFVRANFATCVEKKDGKVYLRNVDLGKGKVDFRVELEKLPAKEGKRAAQKRNLYRIDADGKERLVQFGTFKKKYLYPLMNMVISGKMPKSGKMKVDADLTKKIAAAIRADRKAFTLDKGVLAGKIKDLGDIKLVEKEVTLKTGKKQLARQLFVAGKLTLEGGQLGRIKNAFVKDGAHKTMKDIMAEAEATVSDLI